MAVHRKREAGTEAEASAAGGPAHLSCPFCSSYDINRLFLASLGLDSCDCAACGARWEESKATGEYRGRSQPASVVIPYWT